MKVEIWSDVVCPFCYIGKRRFEEALEKFNGKDAVEIEWKSFQLNPDLKPNGKQNIHEHLAEVKGWTVDYAKQMSKQVSEMAAEVGLTYNMDQTVVANTFDAHRLIQHAKTKGLGDILEEKLFSAYFVEGKDIADFPTLIQIAVECGLEANTIQEILESKQYSDLVEYDVYEASQLGVRGVPFFVFDRKYGISGAQPLEVFERTFQQTLEETNAIK